MIKDERDAELCAVKAQKVELRQQGIRAGFKDAESTVAEESIAKFFYANGLSFGAADSKPDSYYREMVAAIKNTFKGRVSAVLSRCGYDFDTCSRNGK